MQRLLAGNPSGDFFNSSFELLVVNAAILELRKGL